MANFIEGARNLKCCCDRTPLADSSLATTPIEESSKQDKRCGS